MSVLRITQVGSGVGQTKRSTGTLRALGLGRIGATSEHSDSPQLRGMVRRVRHLIRIEGEES